MTISDYTEHECKFYPVNKESFRKQLRKSGAKLEVPERLMKRTIVDRADYPQFGCTYIRVRDEGNVIVLSAKTVAEEGGKLADQKELDVEVNNYDRMVKIIETMGFKFSIYQENYRETWSYEGAEVVIDTWPGLEPYIEIEADSEEKVQEVAEKLGFNWDKKIITSNKEIYAKVYGLTLKKVTQLMSLCTFEKNPYRGLKKVAKA